MTLKGLRNLGLAASMLAMVLVAGALLQASRAVGHAIEVNRTASEIRSDIQEMNYLAIETILYYEKRSQQQWKSKHAALMQRMRGLDLGPEYRTYLEVIRRNLSGAEVLYPRLLDYRQQALSSALEDKEFRQLEARIVSRLLAIFYDMNATSARMSELSLRRIESVRRLSAWLTVTSTVLLTLLVLANWFIINHIILKRISILHHAAQRIAGGDLSVRTGLTGQDEIGELTTTFDAMTARLQHNLKKMEQEIRDRIAAEHALLESREQIRAVTETARDAIISADMDGRIVQFNQGAAEIFGWDPQEAIGMPLQDLVGSEVWREEQRGSARLAFQVEQDEALPKESLARHKNGRMFPAELSVANWSTGKNQYLTIILRDITTRKQAEQQLQQSNRELEAFSYSVSHDLRAPLRHIAGFVALLREECGARVDEHCQEYLNFISDSAARMDELIEDLLAFSRFGRVAIHMMDIDMNALVEETRHAAMNDIGARDVHFLAHSLPHASGDPSLLRQVWVNLLSNAVKYTRPRSRAEIEIGSFKTHDETVFFVRDNGVGFDMRHADKLFGVFQRLHRDDEFEGTGVGLATVRRIVERHGGRIWAESRPGEGATFYFSLPNASS